MPAKPFFQFFFRSVTIGKYKVPVAAILWFVVGTIAAVSKILHSPMNNYFIYQGVFHHSIHQTNLYAPYPAEYYDVNHYGPVFSLVIAPFAVMPWQLGCTIWCIANIAFLYYAVMKLPLSFEQRIGIMYISFIELLISLQNVQFNPMLTAWLMLAFLLTNKGKEWAATFFIVAGFLVKIYGIIGLAAFLFSKQKLRFVLWCFVWMVVLLCLPMLISSPRFVVQSYIDWYNVLVLKDDIDVSLTLIGGSQDISVQGIIRRITQQPLFSQLWVLVPAGILYLLLLTRVKAYQLQWFRLLYLALSLITVVIFSSAAESPTYIIAMMGVAIWFVLQPSPPGKWAIAALVFALLFTSLSHTDLFPKGIRKDFITRYSLKALPCFIIWLMMVWQLLKQPFHPVNSKTITVQ